MEQYEKSKKIIKYYVNFNFALDGKYSVGIYGKNVKIKDSNAIIKIIKKYFVFSICINPFRILVLK